MQLIPREQITKRLQSLLETLGDAYFSEKTADVIGRACQLRDINEDLMSIIARLAGRVLLGYLHPESFAVEIQKETGAREVTAQLVAHDIDGEVFSNVRLELKKLYPPVIQTPTVQTPWSNRTQAPEKFQDSSPKIQEKPKYVIPIPEKFMKREVWGVKQEEAKPQINIPPAKDEIEIGNKESEKKETMQTEIKTTIATEPEPPKSSQPEFKPIVPLPTFIRSQFKAPEQPKTGIVNKREKEFIDKFSAPDPTLAKPETPKTDPYKEQI